MAAPWIHTCRGGQEAGQRDKPGYHSGIPLSKALPGNGVCSSWGGPACNVVGGWKGCSPPLRNHTSLLTRDPEVQTSDHRTP